MSAFEAKIVLELEPRADASELPTFSDPHVLVTWVKKFFISLTPAFSDAPSQLVWLEQKSLELGFVLDKPAVGVEMWGILRAHALAIVCRHFVARCTFSIACESFNRF
jgi:hypothetical protein